MVRKTWLTPLLFICVTVNGQIERIPRNFSSDFLFGAATSAYQIEGGWNEDGKGWSMWDYQVRTNPNYVIDGTSGDIAADSYHLYKRDVQMLKELGAKVYRFSMSWPRILPYGKPNYVNPHGIAYYNNLINELLANGIEPFVTMYHWDLPQNLNEQGNMLNENFVDWFGDYARVLYQNFGDRVKYWMTLNEPYIHCAFAFGDGVHPPRFNSSGVGFYECGRTFILSNARAYRIYYDEGFKASQGGQVGFIINAEWAIPSSDSDDDLEAVEDYFTFMVRQYMDPIFTPQGNYPQRLIDKVAAASAAQGLTKSRLRPLSKEEVQYIRGTSDFLALNHYGTDVVYRNSSLKGSFRVPSLWDDANYGSYKRSDWPMSVCPWQAEYAPGFYELLIHIKEYYNNPTIYITENGFSTTKGLVDEKRVSYLRNYLSAIHQAMVEGVNVKGYFHWSLLDSFEWNTGYTIRFGLYEVDVEDPNRKRTPRKSALVYKEIIRTRTIDYNYNPDPLASQAQDSILSLYSTMSILSVVFVVLSIISK